MEKKEGRAGGGDNDVDEVAKRAASEDRRSRRTSNSHDLCPKNIKHRIKHKKLGAAAYDDKSVYFKFRLRRNLRDPNCVESNSPSVRRMWSTNRHVASGDLVIVWLVRPPPPARPSLAHHPPDSRPRPVPRRHSRQVVQQQIRRLPTRGPRRHPLRLKSRLAHRKGIRTHPPSHPGIMDPRITSPHTDPLSRRHRLYHLVAPHQTRHRRD